MSKLIMKLCFLLFILSGCSSHANDHFDSKNFFIKVNDKYVSSRDGSLYLAPQNEKSAFKIIRNANGTHSISLMNSRFIGASNDHKSLFTTKTIGEWEQFRIQEVNGQVYLKTIHDTFLRANFDTHALDQSPNRQWWERFTLELANNVETDFSTSKLFFLKSVNGYVSTRDGQAFLTMGADKRAFKFIKNPDASYHIALSNGHYLGAHEDKKSMYTGGNRGEWERFYLEKEDNGEFYLRSIHGTYVRANADSHKLDQSPNRQAWERFSVEEDDKTDSVPSSYLGGWDVFVRTGIDKLFAKNLSGRGAHIKIAITETAYDPQGFGIPSNPHNRDGLSDEDVQLEEGGLVFPGSKGISISMIPIDNLHIGNEGSHGTNMLRILAGRRNESFRGVAPGAKILFMPNAYSMTYTRIINYLKREKNVSISSVSLQLHNFHDLAIAEKLEDFLLVVIAGNNNDPNHPQVTSLEQFSPDLDNEIYHKLIFTVAVDKNNAITRASKRCGQKLADFCIAVPGGEDGTTSPTAPIVSGVVALLMEAFPHRPMQDYQRAILETAIPLANRAETGRGLLNAIGAYEYLQRTQ